MSERKRGIRIQTRIIISALLLLLQLFFLFYVLYDITARSVALYALSMIAGTVTVIYILNRRGNPDHKIAWIIFILVFPVFGISVFLLWGGGRVLPHLRKKMEKCEAHYLPYLKEDSDYEQNNSCHRRFPWDWAGNRTCICRLWLPCIFKL